MTGAAGHVCQGDDWKTAKPVAFWSGKFTAVGTKFTIVTDHERLQSLPTQKDLNRRQTRWMEELSDFDFEILWVEGKSNVFADALSRIYSSDVPGTERAPSEYVNGLKDEDEDESVMGLFAMTTSESPSRPIRVGSEIEAELEVSTARKAWKPTRARGSQKCRSQT